MSKLTITVQNYKVTKSAVLISDYKNPVIEAQGGNFLFKDDTWSIESNELLNAVSGYFTCAVPKNGYTEIGENMIKTGNIELPDTSILKLEFENSETEIEYAAAFALLLSLTWPNRATTDTLRDYTQHAGRKLAVTVP